MCAHPPATVTLDDRRRYLVECARARAMARRIATRFGRGRCLEDRQDYHQAALAGLAEAASRFDFDHPLTCSTLESTFCAFSYVYALNSVLGLCRQEHAAPRHMQTYVASLRRRGLDPADDRITPDDERTAAMLGMRADSVSRQRRLISERHDRQLSLDQSEDGEAGGRDEDDRDPLWIDNLIGSASAEDAAMDSLRDGAVRNAIAGLSRELRPVLTLYCEGFTRPEIAEQMGLPERRVKACLAEGFAILRERLAHLCPD